MEIKKLVIQNFKSIGNKKVILDFENDFINNLVLLTGRNGSGKCLSSDTEIEIEIENELVSEKLLRSLKEKYI